MRKIVFLIVFLGLSMMSKTVFSAIIYDNGGPDLDISAGYPADYSYPARNAENFILQDGSSTVTDIHWWGFYGAGSQYNDPDDFTITIFDTSDTSLHPYEIVYNNNVGNVTRNRISFKGVFYYYYSIYLNPILLNSNQTYWLQIMNNTDSDVSSGSSWKWYLTKYIDGYAVRYEYPDITYDWEFQENDLAFNLTNDAAPVPEPSTFILLGAGLAGLGFVVRRRKKQ